MKSSPHGSTLLSFGSVLGTALVSQPPLTVSEGSCAGDGVLKGTPTAGSLRSACAALWKETQKMATLVWHGVRHLQPQHLGGTGR